MKGKNTPHDKYQECKNSLSAASRKITRLTDEIFSLRSELDRVSAIKVEAQRDSERIYSELSGKCIELAECKQQNSVLKWALSAIILVSFISAFA